jgi:hypothetical protein
VITDLDQAFRVQMHRVTAGKKGHAKAVRRFMLREFRRTGDDRFAPWRKSEWPFEADFTACGPYVPNKGAKL